MYGVQPQVVIFADSEYTAKPLARSERLVTSDDGLAGLVEERTFYGTEDPCRVGCSYCHPCSVISKLIKQPLTILTVIQIASFCKLHEKHLCLVCEGRHIK